jgi:hypothetical protein
VQTAVEDGCVEAHQRPFRTVAAAIESPFFVSYRTKLEKPELNGSVQEGPIEKSPFSGRRTHVLCWAENAVSNNHEFV